MSTFRRFWPWSTFAKLEATLAEERAARVRAETLAHESLRYYRVGHFELDPYALTAKLRGDIEPTIKVEYDGAKVVVLCERILEESQVRAIVSTLGIQLNRFNRT